MIKNYAFFFLFYATVGSFILHSQEIRIFTIADFDLRGKVKRCLVSTDYGKEEYDFDEDGRLTKSVTRYNENDYDVTYYKYEQGELIEKRFENYRDKQFDEATSIANFYQIDSTQNRKVVEKIVSYDKSFLDQYEYLYDANGQLAKIIRTNEEGIDETNVEYKDYKNEHTVSYLINGEIQKSIRTSIGKSRNGATEKVVLTKKYIEGAPNTAMEEVYDGSDRLVSKTDFYFDLKIKQFAPETIITYGYDESDRLISTKTERGKAVERKEYIYQFDNEESGNWVKQIITPDNSYTTRKITYYELTEEVKQGD
ncbi:hypothetical protein FK220_007840 [Flavobacteriaceae bacterium TP-CH-4]|uniref:YD repeat-containing protein n=1 Tax=Pelagihabitans pacificus TaxID=2696054 RepID=A0A967AX69_9FLAO|nr:hypothetical protein [Pelagihabitans pacificus]NHF59247.1 hypothetical protein [Pelagihabitans pacificus]